MDENHLSLPSSTSGHGESSVRIVFDDFPNVATSDSSLNIGIRFGPTFHPLKVDPLSVDSIEWHNRVSGKGFPTTGPRIEAGNVVTRLLVVACAPSGVRNCVRIGTDVGCSVRGSLLSGFWSWSLVVEGRTRLICASCGSTRLICASSGSTRLICASLGITRLIGVSFGITRLICAFYGTTRLLCRVRVQRGADRREAGRMREGHMDASGFLYASADVVPDQLSVEAKHLRDFRKYNPTTFDGSLEDPTRAQLWLSSLETIFRYMKCPEDQKVQCAVFMLTDRGTAWWETTERMLGGDVSQITWQQFKESFYAKFFSASLRDAKRQEFLNLEQGDMTVEQYDAEFDMLSRFAPEMIVTEAARADKFVRGL
ncbi:gag-protease polyprotein [Cucumis melo var. makuwa]|uniref:Gag-protease polyprotein n=1 Tax=Cucumis melo var. makuwa TaxID=1194695 RepID=A0A5A7SPY6_CUCMM|nr:gag-protease polyprotein [Cucumis melo var. makuwa]